MSISGTLAHVAKEGDGIRARVVSSRQGELGTWFLHKLEAQTGFKGVAVKKGDSIDFVVDIRNNLNSDDFTWAPAIQMDGDKGGVWDSAREFSGPPPTALAPIEKYAQVLLLTNEFAFVD